MCYHFIFLLVKIFLNILLPNTLSVFALLNVSQNVLYPYRTIGKNYSFGYSNFYNFQTADGKTKVDTKPDSLKSIDLGFEHARGE
jgi:hypothetical protein